jgi:hypothetical protein
MAIKIPWKAAQGTVLPDAYLRVMAFQGNTKYVSYSVQVWPNEQARQEERAMIEERNFRFPYPPGRDIVAACYQHLKSLPDFSAGVDV